MNDGQLDDALFVAAERGDQHNHNIAYFEYHPVLNAQKTAEKGIEVWEDVVYIKIISPGQRLSDVHRKATDKDKANYPKQYEAFLAKKVQPIIGTPLAMLPGITPARVRELAFLNIRTVQHLIDMPDSALPKVGPDALKLRQTAQAFIDKNDPIIIALEQRVKELEAVVKSLQTLAAAPAQGSDLHKRRGRPPKVSEPNDLSVGGAKRVP